jgi:hypothetical protein
VAVHWQGQILACCHDHQLEGPCLGRCQKTCVPLADYAPMWFAEACYGFRIDQRRSTAVFLGLLHSTYTGKLVHEQSVASRCIRSCFVFTDTPERHCHLFAPNEAVLPCAWCSESDSTTRVST